MDTFGTILGIVIIIFVTSLMSIPFVIGIKKEIQKSRYKKWYKTECEAVDDFNQANAVQIRNGEVQARLYPPQRTNWD